MIEVHVIELQQGPIGVVASETFVYLNAMNELITSFRNVETSHHQKLVILNIHYTKQCGSYLKVSNAQSMICTYHCFQNNSLKSSRGVGEMLGTEERRLVVEVQSNTVSSAGIFNVLIQRNPYYVHQSNVIPYQLLGRMIPFAGPDSRAWSKTCSQVPGFV